MNKGFALLLTTTALLVPFSAGAGEKEDQLIEQVTEAYGGDKIRNLTSFVIEKAMLGPASGQSRTPQLDNLSTNTFYAALDIKNGKSRSDTLFSGRGGNFQAATIIDGDEAWNLNYQANSYGTAPNADIYAIAGGSMRLNDAILAYELHKAKETSKYLGEAEYMNRPHVKIQFPYPLSPDLTLYIDEETHFISRMVRTNPQIGQLDYVFSNMTEANGIPYAEKTSFFIAGIPNLISTQNRSQFNVSIPATEFKIPTAMAEESDRIDTSEMIANRITDSIYHVGQGGGFSLFINTSDGIVAAGGYPGLKDRLARFRTESGNHKQLRYQVVTHHHQDHLGGLNEAIDLGATLVTVEDNVDAITDFVANAEDANFLHVSQRLTIGEGKNRVEIYDVSTIHAAHFLVTYVPAEKLVFIADHLNSPYERGIPTANLSTVTMHSALKELGLDIRKITIAHGARVFTMKDMQASVDAYKPSGCLADRPVCM
jgi:glyoxylase-like metal-dependent hydrolase (beta-lactamase superfamily II)